MSYIKGLFLQNKIHKQVKLEKQIKDEFICLQFPIVLNKLSENYKNKSNLFNLKEIIENEIPNMPFPIRAEFEQAII